MSKMINENTQAIIELSEQLRIQNLIKVVSLAVDAHVISYDTYQNTLEELFEQLRTNLTNLSEPY